MTITRLSTASCFGPAVASPGGTCPSATGRERWSTSASRAGRPTGLGRGSRPACTPLRRGRGAGLGRADRLDGGAGPPVCRRWPQRGSCPTRGQTGGAWPLVGELTTKLHTICHGRGRNLAIRPIPGQAADPLACGAGGRHAGSGLAGMAGPASVGPPDRRQGLEQLCESGSVAGPSHPSHHPAGLALGATDMLTEPPSAFGSSAPRRFWGTVT